MEIGNNGLYRIGALSVLLLYTDEIKGPCPVPIKIFYENDRDFFFQRTEPL